MKSAITFISLILLIIYGCGKKETTRHDRYLFPNVLNIKNIPSHSNDHEAFCFFDEGAWFGFALPVDSATSSYGTFPGPYLIKEGKWLSDALFKLKLTNIKNDSVINFAKSFYLENNYYPGILKQTQITSGMRIGHELIFIDSAAVLIKVAVNNLTSRDESFKISWSGALIDTAFHFSPVNNSIVISNNNEKDSYQIVFPDELVGNTVINKKRNNYIFSADNIYDIKSARRFTTYLIFSEYSKDKNREQQLRQIFMDPEIYINENEKRWNRYVTSVLTMDEDWTANKSYARLAVKCLNTLTNNWRCSNDDIHRAGLFPSYTDFTGFWAWDSWKHAAVLSVLNPGLAKDQIRAMFDYQTVDGMVPDVIFADKSQNNFRDTKPPLAAWAVEKIFDSTGDTSFVKEMYNDLARYHYWWYKNRDHDSNGLCEYGSADGTLQAAKWESGMDDAVRFDDAKMLKNQAGAWSMDRESVDLNCYLYKEKIILARFAHLLNKEQAESKFQNEADNLLTRIRNTFYDKTAGWFYDVKLNGGGFVKTAGPEGWIPLWAKVATKEEAEKVFTNIVDTTKFNTFVPLPSVSKSSDKFNTGYWRGPVWLDQAYFAVEGLENYGYNDAANKLIQKLIANAEGLLNSPKPVRENYDPLTGKELNAKNFSWSAASLILMMQR